MKMASEIAAIGLALALIVMSVRLWRVERERRRRERRARELERWSREW